MGEHADDIVDRMIEEGQFSALFLCRRRDGNRPHKMTARTCKHCGKGMLKWGKVHNRKTEYQLQELDGTPYCCDLSSALPNLEDEESP